MGFGSDFSGFDDLDQNLTFLSGEEDELTALAQAIARRLITPRGALWYDQSYGYDLRNLVSSNGDPAQSIASIEAEARKDERITDCVATIDVIGTGAGVIWNVSIDCTASTGATLSFTLAVSAVSVELLTVGP